MQGQEFFKTEQGISDCYMKGVLKHSGSISGFIYIVTQLVKNADGDGSLIHTDVDEAIARLLGELSAQATSRGKVKTQVLPTPSDDSQIPDLVNRSYWLSQELKPEVPPPIEEVIAQAAESLADPNFFIAEISGILSALVELKSVCQRRQ